MILRQWHTFFPPPTAPSIAPPAWEWVIDWVALGVLIAIPASAASYALRSWLRHRRGVGFRWRAGNGCALVVLLGPLALLIAIPYFRAVNFFTLSGGGRRALCEFMPLFVVPAFAGTALAAGLAIAACIAFVTPYQRRGLAKMLGLALLVGAGAACVILSIPICRALPKY